MSDREARTTEELPAAITPRRTARLYQFLKTLASGPQDRETMCEKLDLDLRGFYRELELLRRCGIPVTILSHRYALTVPLEAALARLPFVSPTPMNLRDALELARSGETPAHRKLRGQLRQLLGRLPPHRNGES